MIHRIIKNYKLLLLLFFICILLIGYLLSWIPKESIEYTVKVYMYDSNKNATISKYDDNVYKEDILTVKGNIYKPWFSNGGFSGDIIFEKNTKFSRQVDFMYSTVEIDSEISDSATDRSYKNQSWINKLTYTKKYNSEEMTQDEIISISFDDSSKVYYVEIKDKNGNYYFSSDKYE